MPNNVEHLEFGFCADRAQCKHFICLFSCDAIKYMKLWEMFRNFILIETKKFWFVRKCAAQQTIKNIFLNALKLRVSLAQIKRRPANDNEMSYKNKCVKRRDHHSLYHVHFRLTAAHTSQVPSGRMKFQWKLPPVYAHFCGIFILLIIIVYTQFYLRVTPPVKLDI